MHILEEDALITMGSDSCDVDHEVMWRRELRKREKKVDRGAFA